MPSDDAPAIITDAGVRVSTTAEMEMQMGFGEPVATRPDLRKVSSLGVDYHTAHSASIVEQMHLLMQNARANRNAYVLDEDKMPSRASPTVEEIFNLGTIQGARAIGMGDQLGSLTEGKLADLVIFDATTPSLICGGQQDPLAAIVMHSSPRDIHTVIIDGKIRKQAGGLLPIELLVPGANASNEKQYLEWSDVARKLLQSREELQDRIATLNIDMAKEGLMKAFQISTDKFADPGQDQSPCRDHEDPQ